MNMETEQFSLCWNNFHQNLRTGFHSLLQEEDLVDVTLAVEGQFLKAHKTVLSVCSPYFKELFKANPCKHPIVILQDVKYTSLCSLLEFMYQGEVSVSQDEIPIFMKVAEMLKIKGLTENSGNSTDSNGIDDDRSSPYTYDRPDSRQALKGLKHSKRIIRPIQHLRPLDSPNAKLPLSQLSPPLKKLCTEGNQECTTETPNLPINPKQEPIDKEDEDDDDEYRDSLIDENHLDMASMLDTRLSEPCQSSGSWTPGSDQKWSADTSSPGGLLFLKSRKGHPVLINNGHIYTLSHKHEGSSTWYCVKRNTLHCEGCLVTTTGPTLLSYSGHNHAQLHDVIQRLQAFSCSSTATSS